MKPLLNKGQVLSTPTLVMGVVMFAASWLGGFVLNSVKDSPTITAAVSERVAKVETNDKNQDARISDVATDVKHMREILDTWAQRQGISIKTTNE